MKQGTGNREQGTGNREENKRRLAEIFTTRFVSGHDFSRAEEETLDPGALAPETSREQPPWTQSWEAANTGMKELKAES
jgi:hypothetical protein